MRCEERDLSVCSGGGGISRGCVCVCVCVCVCGRCVEGEKGVGGCAVRDVCIYGVNVHKTVCNLISVQ